MAESSTTLIVFAMIGIGAIMLVAGVIFVIHEAMQRRRSTNAPLVGAARVFLMLAAALFLALGAWAGVLGVYVMINSNGAIHEIGGMLTLMAGVLSLGFATISIGIVGILNRLPAHRHGHATPPQA